MKEIVEICTTKEYSLDSKYLDCTNILSNFMFGYAIKKQKHMHLDLLHIITLYIYIFYISFPCEL